jgi:hypothetical protein
MSKGACTNRGRRNRRNNKHKEVEPRLGVVDRRARATERSATKRTPLQQLQELDARLGVGVGAKREREKLVARITRGKVA